MHISTPDLGDEHGEAVQAAAPIFSHYCVVHQLGVVHQFGAEVATVKCFEDTAG